MVSTREHLRGPSGPSYHVISALIEILINVDTVAPAIPSLLHLIPVLEFHTGDVIFDGTEALD